MSRLPCLSAISVVFFVSLSISNLAKKFCVIPTRLRCVLIYLRWSFSAAFQPTHSIHLYCFSCLWVQAHRTLNYFEFCNWSYSEDQFWNGGNSDLSLTTFCSRVSSFASNRLSTIISSLFSREYNNVRSPSNFRFYYFCKLVIAVGKGCV